MSGSLTYVRWCGFFVCCVCWSSVVDAEVYRVPYDYLTIQAALDAVTPNDTVLVSLGTYVEELTTPPLPFWLLGDVEIDTGDFARPIVDPSGLDSARWRRCLNVPDGSEPVVERMGFQNRSPMYPPYDSSQTGGVFVNSVLPVTFRHCTFDSVHRAIAGGNFLFLPLHFVVEDCRFTHATHSQIRTDYPEGMIEVRRTTFQGGHYNAGFAMGGNNSTIEECTFSGDSMSHSVILDGVNLVVRNCIFGASDSLLEPPLHITSRGGALVEGNVFRNLRVNNGVAVIGYHSGAFAAFRHNQISDNSTWSAFGCGCVSVAQDYNALPGVNAVVDSNIFENNTQISGVNGKAIYLNLRGYLAVNRFIGLTPIGAPAIDYWFGNAVSVLRYNQLQAGDYAVRAGTHVIDATWNYWGDSTGPYNALHNPEGQGARVDDAVLFDPWFPDTNFFGNPAMATPARLPREFVLNAYPNPFNSTVHLTLIPTQAQIVKVELFDLLGRRVKESWSGPLTFQKEITFDAGDLASGIYFARVSDVLDLKTMATTKLILLK